MAGPNSVGFRSGPLVRVRIAIDANPGRLTNSPARTDVALLIRRAVRPTKWHTPFGTPGRGFNPTTRHCM